MYVEVVECHSCVFRADLLGLDPNKTGSSFSAAFSSPWFGEMPVQTMLQFHSTTIMPKIHKNKLTINIGEVVGKGTLHYL